MKRWPIKSLKLWQCSACHESKEDCKAPCQVIVDSDIIPNQCLSDKDIDQSSWSEIEPIDLLEVK